MLGAFTEGNTGGFLKIYSLISRAGMYFFIMEAVSMEEILKILKKIKPDIDFEKCDLLLDDGILDSFDIVVLVNELNQKFKISIPVECISSKNLNSYKAISKMIDKLRENAF
jgi:D-alanine--poly(phosphoribitol) ligase subunit 2